MRSGGEDPGVVHSDTPDDEEVPGVVRSNTPDVEEVPGVVRSDTPDVGVEPNVMHSNTPCVGLAASKDTSLLGNMFKQSVSPLGVEGLGVCIA